MTEDDDIPSSVRCDESTDGKLPQSTNTVEAFLSDSNRFSQKVTEVYLKLLNDKHDHDQSLPDKPFQPNDEFLAAVHAEIASIKSCVSSASSSACTNLTNDSGSYMLIDNEHVPMHHITKPWVPFEETDRQRVIAARLDAATSKSVHYRPPYSGQYNEMREQMLAHGRNEAAAKRSSALHAARSHKPNESVAGHKISMAKQFERHYISDTRGKLPLVKFKPKQFIATAHQMLREQYEMLHVQASLLRENVHAQQQDHIAANTQQWNQMAQKMLNKMQREALSKSRLASENLTVVLNDSKLHAQQAESMRNQINLTKLDILKIENEMRDRTVHQKVHYLLMDDDWRHQHDWLHRRADGTLEDYRESIANRMRTHLRQRDTDNVWSVKQFYEQHYFDQCETIMVFDTAELFAARLEKLKSQTAERMRKLNVLVQDLIDAQVQLQVARTAATDVSECQQRKLMHSSNRTRAMAVREQQLSEKTIMLMGEPLRVAITDDLMNRTIALSNVLFKRIVPSEARRFVDRKATVIDTLAVVIDRVRELLWQLDSIPARIQKVAAKEVRCRRAFMRKEALNAYELECRLARTLQRLKKTFEPPTKPAKAPTKRYHLRPKAIVHEQPVVIVPKSIQLLRKAFGDAFEQSAADSVDVLQQFESLCVPFYFDHFLELRGHKPQVTQRTRIEMRDGAEERRFKYHDVMADTMKRFTLLDARLQQKRKQDIEKLAHLYEGK